MQRYYLTSLSLCKPFPVRVCKQVDRLQNCAQCPTRDMCRQFLRTILGSRLTLLQSHVLVRRACNLLIPLARRPLTDSYLGVWPPVQSGTWHCCSTSSNREICLKRRWSQQYGASYSHLQRNSARRRGTSCNRVHCALVCGDGFFSPLKKNGKNTRTNVA